MVRSRAVPELVSSGVDRLTHPIHVRLEGLPTLGCQRQSVLQPVGTSFEVILSDERIDCTMKL
jgi:hypothetical protein